MRIEVQLTLYSKNVDLRSQLGNKHVISSLRCLAFDQLQLLPATSPSCFLPVNQEQSNTAGRSKSSLH
jgi:hypothetical protein